MTPAKLGQVFHVPYVVMVIVAFLSTNLSVIQYHSCCLGNSLVSKLHPPFGVVPLPILLKLLPPLTNMGIYNNRSYYFQDKNSVLPKGRQDTSL